MRKEIILGYVQLPSKPDQLFIKPFRNQNINQTSLSKEVINLQNKNIDYDIEWKAIDRGKPFCPNNIVCQLCTKEAYHIIFNPELADLNSKNEVFSCCRHKKGTLLCINI